MVDKNRSMEEYLSVWPPALHFHLFALHVAAVQTCL
jgi:hypothetical protein